MAIEFISINEIFVNPENPRHNPTLDDITAINQLIKESPEDMFELINSINDSGFFPQKVVSLIVKNDKKIAIDGNRRIAAIKCALNTEIISDKRFKNKIERLVLKNISPEMNIPCTQYSNIQDAIPFILAEHTEGGQTKKWTRIQQCYFMLKYGTRSDVPEIFLLYNDNFSREFNSGIENFSTIERVIKKEHIEKLSKLDSEILKQILGQFVIDTNDSGNYTSRNLNTASQQNDYISKVFSKFLPRPVASNQTNNQNTSQSKSTQLTTTKPSSSVGAQSSPTPQPTPTISHTNTSNSQYNVKPKSTSHAFKSLKWTGLDPNSLMTKSIIDVAKEIKDLAKFYDKFPISTTILIRTLLELSLKYWLATRHSKKYTVLVNNARGKAKDPQLSDIIKEINDQIRNHNTIFDLQLDDSFITYFSSSDTTMKDRMDILVHRPWALGTNAQLYKLYEDDFIYTIINFILNTK